MDQPSEGGAAQEVWRTVGVGVSASALQSSSPGRPAAAEVRDVLGSPGFGCSIAAQYLLCGLVSFSAAFPAAAVVYTNADSGGSTGPEDDCKTLTCEFDLSGPRSIMRPVLDSLFFGGVAWGAFAAGWLADRFGRKPVVVVATFGVAIVSPQQTLWDYQVRIAMPYLIIDYDLT